MNHLIVAGGRDFSDWVMFYRHFNQWFAEHDPEYQNTTIVSGMATGADTMGYLTAEERGLPVLKFYADWEKFGKRAGGIRNQKMADVSTHLIAFWDGKSTGTKDMIQRARILGIDVSVVRYTLPTKPVKKVKTLW